MEKNVISSDSEMDIEVKHANVQVESPGLEEIDPVAERKLVRKLDLILLPMFCLICKFMVFAEIHYLNDTVSIDCMNFIDRHVLSERDILVD
jgi:hypothetical protein